MPLRPSELLIFGDPTAGTGPMQPEQTIGIDLLLKALVWGRCERWRVDLLRCPSVASGTAGLHHGSANAVHATVGVLAKFAEGGGRRLIQRRDRPTSWSKLAKHGATNHAMIDRSSTLWSWLSSTSCQRAADEGVVAEPLTTPSPRPRGCSTSWKPQGV